MTVYDHGDNQLLNPPVNANATTDGTQSNYLICQRSGFRVSVKEGLIQDGETGVWVRKEDYDPMHPQRFVRSLPETESKGSVSPEQPDNLLAASLSDPDAL